MKYSRTCRGCCGRVTSGLSGNSVAIPPIHRPRKTLAFYRDCPAPGAGGARLYRAVTIEPFEVSRWRGGCGGLLWDFNQPESVVASRCGRLLIPGLAQRRTARKTGF
jgi:hypothetical protein